LELWIACFEVLTMDAKPFSYYAHEIIMYRRRAYLLKPGFSQAGNGAENTKKNPGSALLHILY
jgi:hypothetical protein